MRDTEQLRGSKHGSYASREAYGYRQHPIFNEEEDDEEDVEDVARSLKKNAGRFGRGRVKRAKSTKAPGGKRKGNRKKRRGPPPIVRHLNGDQEAKSYQEDVFTW